MGLRTFSGLSVGLLGASIGIHNSLSYSAAALFLVYAAIIAPDMPAGAGAWQPSDERAQRRRFHAPCAAIRGAGGRTARCPLARVLVRRGR